jgi:hypothetical protein
MAHKNIQVVIKERVAALRNLRKMTEKGAVIDGLL